jgi:hypothetical protein
MPAPATEPRFMPMLNPCAPEVARTAAMVRLVKSLNSAVSGPVRSV